MQNILLKTGACLIEVRLRPEKIFFVSIKGTHQHQHQVACMACNITGPFQKQKKSDIKGL